MFARVQKMFHEAAEEKRRFDESSGAYKRENKLRRSNSSGTKGVSFHKGKRKWIARMRKNGKDIHLGAFATKEEAIVRATAACGDRENCGYEKPDDASC